MTKWITLGLLLLGATPAWATIYYVSKGTTGATGNDSNSCTTATNIATPKLTISGTTGGLSCVTAAGDTLYIRGGTYAEWIDPGGRSFASGTSWSAPVTISSYNNEVVTLTGVRSGATINMNATISYVIFNGLTVDQGGTADADGISLYTNGTTLTSHHLRVSNCTVQNIFQNGIAAGGSGNPDGNEFINNTVHDTGKCATLSACHSVQPHGFYVHGTNMIIDGNTVYKSLDLGIQVYGGDSTGTIIRNNKVYDNCHMSGQSCAGIITGTGSNIKVYNNIVYDNGFTGGATNGSGITFGNTCTNCQVYNNVVYHNQTDGIENAHSSGGIICNNTIYNNGVYGILLQNFGANNNTLCNNLLWANASTAISIDAGVTGTVQTTNWTTSDPLFVDPTATPPNFKLQDTSPAIDKGTITGPATSDIVGTLRPKGTSYEPGAYEYVSGSGGGTQGCTP